MTDRWTSAAICFRRFAAVLLTLAVVVVSLASGVREALSAAPGKHQSIAELVTPHPGTPKPCQRTTLPGGINTCPLAGINFTSLPADESTYATPALALRTFLWRFMNSRLLAQCNGISPYRPPCSFA